MIKESDQPYSICAIDASTNSLAFAIYSDKNLIEYGKINFEGNNVYEKIIDACKKSNLLFMLGFPYLIAKSTMILSLPIFSFNF